MYIIHILFHARINIEGVLIASLRISQRFIKHVERRFIVVDEAAQQWNITGWQSMFIRWIERPGQQFTALSVILAETKRVKGVPRQRHIAYLGGITDEQIEHPSSRCVFWDQVTAAFDRLDNKVTPEDRHRFEAAIAARVPRPTAKDYKALERERREREAWMEEALRCAAEYRLMSSAPFLHTHCAFCGRCGTDMVKGDTGAMICDACIAKAVAERKAKASPLLSSFPEGQNKRHFRKWWPKEKHPSPSEYPPRLRQAATKRDNCRRA